ncbi:hypothetical protein EGW08_018885 [Elysia chlorotica]|uniref:Uncharacterized protein n=1 Tax=Elysia chlorotica TaxID=188477 RepID=A0A433SVN0_ELYCH|nr:hypothetical protein EGW08_018885 [Elysia chlorotica]
MYYLNNVQKNVFTTFILIILLHHILLSIIKVSTDEICVWCCKGKYLISHSRMFCCRLPRPPVLYTQTALHSIPRSLTFHPDERLGDLESIMPQRSRKYDEMPK